MEEVREMVKEEEEVDQQEEEEEEGKVEVREEEEYLERKEKERGRRRRQLGQVIRDNLQTRWIILAQRHDEPGEQLNQLKASMHLQQSSSGSSLPSRRPR